MNGITAPGIESPVIALTTDELRISSVVRVCNWHDCIRLRYISAMRFVCALDPDRRKTGAMTKARAPLRHDSLAISA